MRRRKLIALFSSTAASFLAATIPRAHAQQATRPRRIAIVHPSAPIADLSETGANPNIAALLVELRRLGYVESENLAVERYSGEGQTQRYAELARDVVRSAPDLIVTTSNRMVLHFATATSTIPIVGFTVDPVATGLVASLARPGGNFTGVVIDAGLETWAKRFEILKEMVPTARRVAFLTADLTLIPRYMPTVRAAAAQVGIMLLDATLGEAIHEGAYRSMFERLVQMGADGLAVNESSENATHQRLIVELAQMTRLPAIYPFREFVLSGGLVAYAFNSGDVGRHAASQIDSILRGGRRPAEMPFYQAERFDLIVNVKAAATLGLTVPQSLLIRADEVIE
jgi:putative ABC transport system substrate-binding protein